jgi:hypothetical protein
LIAASRRTPLAREETLRRTLAGLCVALIPALAAAAETAPSELLGKSVVVMWGETRMQRNVGQPNFREVAASQTLSVYVSSAGRAFIRVGFQTRAGTGAVERVAEEAKNSPTYSGQSMRLELPFRTGGARQVEIEFADGFASCNAKVAYRKPPGNALDVGFSPITRKFIEFQSFTTDAVNCAVKPGNVFATD